MYGNLQVVKQIGDNPGNLPLDDVEFTFAYDCTLTHGHPGCRGHRHRDPDHAGRRDGHPVGGSTCEVWETGTNGGIPDATEADPASVVIEPSLDPTPRSSASVTVTNDFPLGELELLKEVTGVRRPGLHRRAVPGHRRLHVQRDDRPRLPRRTSNWSPGVPARPSKRRSAACAPSPRPTTSARPR